MTTTTTLGAIEQALHALLQPAIASVEGAPDALILNDPSVVERPTSESGQQVNASLIRGRVARGEALMGGAAIVYEPQADFLLALHGVGADSDDRSELVDAMRAAVSAALGADPRLGGLAGYAWINALEPDVERVEGQAPETLHVLTIQVLFQSLSPVG